MSAQPQAAAPAGRGVSLRRALRTFSIKIPRTDALLMLLLFIIAIAPRAAWIAYNDRAPQPLNDPVFYDVYSERIADGQGYTRPTNEATAYYPVGYPATLGGLKKAGDIFGWGRSIFASKMMNGMFGAITVLLLYLIAVRMFDRRIAFGAGLLEAIFPSQVYYTGTLLSEAEFTMLFLAALLVLVWHPWTRQGLSWQRLLAAGVLLSAATMVRGILLVFPLLLFAMWVFYLRSWKRALLHAAIVLAGVAVFTVPWSIRNTLAFHELTGPSTNLGDDLCVGNARGASGHFFLGGKCFEGDFGHTFQEIEIQRNREGVRMAIEDVLSSPGRMPALVGQKVYWLLHYDGDGLVAAESYGNDIFMSGYRISVLNFAANAIYYPTGALVLLGSLAFALASDVRRAFAFFAMLYVLAIPLIFFGDPRFHFPAVPLMVLIAVWTIVAIWDRRQRPLPAMERIGA